MKPSRRHLAALDLLAWGLRPEAEGGAWAGLSLKPEDFPVEERAAFEEVTRAHTGGERPDVLHRLDIYSRIGDVQETDPAELVRRLRAAKSDQSDQSDTSDASDKIGHDRTAIGQESDRNRTNRTAEGARFEGNLTAALEEWIDNSTGSFTFDQLCRVFSLTLRQDRKRLSDALSKKRKEGKIREEGREAGRYGIVDSSVSWLSLDGDQEEEAFPVSLPLDLGRLVKLPGKSVAILAGATNAGKTALLLEVARRNMASISTAYFMSEMGAGEFRNRLRLFGQPPEDWKALRAAERTCNFDEPIGAHNPDGLNLIDFLEERDGEYFRIASDIRAVYDALGQGLAFIAIQKKAGSLYARGGEATMEKARLYLLLDKLCDTPGGPICALRVAKAKCWASETNPNGLEKHFRLVKGHRMEPIGPWQRLNDQQRAKLVAGYLKPPAPSAPAKAHWQDTQDREEVRL